MPLYVICGTICSSFIKEAGFHLANIGPTLQISTIEFVFYLWLLLVVSDCYMLLFTR